MPKLTIDGEEIEVESGLTVLQACELAGKEIPRFCYHERLSVAGNCRMCLVEMERAPKPIASCAMPVGEGMVIKTDTEVVKRAREGVMEFLLINHPLDCPICDQGGECDLQDQAMGYGMDKSRFIENKRAVEDKYLGPLVSTIMTRCIHCTRCIRFAQEVAGVPELGATGRGEHMEVGTYVEKALSSEMSGNIVDLCPVGALTSKPYAFTARSWELKKTESIDVLDAVGCNIRIDTRGSEVMRILPRNHDDVNEEWISDKTRHACDGLKRQRLDQPFLRKDGKLLAADWPEVLTTVAEKINAADVKIGAIAGDLADCESMTALMDLMVANGSGNIDCRQDGGAVGDTRASYIFNSTIAGIEDADALLLIGTNPRLEAPVLNTRIRKRYLRGGFAAGLIGPRVDLTYDAAHLGDGPSALDDLLASKGDFSDLLKQANKPLIIIGSGALARDDGASLLAKARQLAEKTGAVRDDWNGFNVLQRAASRVGGLDLGFVPKNKSSLDTAGIVMAAGAGKLDVVYLLGADEIDMQALGDAFVIYQGHHGDAGAHRADAILPGAAYTEKNATYVNTEGRVQRAALATFPVGEAKEDWAIIRALSESMGKKLPYDSLVDVRRRMADINPVFSTLDETVSATWGDTTGVGTTRDAPFKYPIGNFYMTDAISRASEVMAACTALARVVDNKATGNNG